MNRYVITDYGVKADTSELQTKEMQAVLDKCKDGGGTVVATGTPEQVAENERSYTGQYLKKILSK